LAPLEFPAAPTSIRRSGKMAKEKRENVMLVCSETGDINYYTSRNKMNEKLELMKYSPRLRKRTVHKEKRRK
jgi:large subunit ribosomal protein L33